MRNLWPSGVPRLPETDLTRWYRPEAWESPDLGETATSRTASATGSSRMGSPPTDRARSCRVYDDRRRHGALDVVVDCAPMRPRARLRSETLLAMIGSA